MFPWVTAPKCLKQEVLPREKAAGSFSAATADYNYALVPLEVLILTLSPSCPSPRSWVRIIYYGSLKPFDMLNSILSRESDCLDVRPDGAAGREREWSVGTDAGRPLFDLVTLVAGTYLTTTGNSPPAGRDE